MILIDIFHLLMSVGEKVLNKPDDIIEFYDKDLQVLGDNKEFMKRLIATLPGDNNALKYPESDAKKKLKVVMDLWNDILEFEKYLASNAAGARERQRALLIAMAVLEAQLNHEAMTSEFWETLSNQYIQYLQDRLDNLINMLSKVDAEISKLNYEINHLQERIDAYDRNIEKEMGDLINIAQQRVDAVHDVVTDSYNNHLNALGDINQNLANLVIEKEAKYTQAVAALEAFHHTHPDAPASALESFVGIVNSSKQELKKMTDFLGTIERVSTNINSAKHQTTTQLNRLNEQLQKTTDPKEKLSILQKRDDVVNHSVLTHQNNQNDINELRKTAENLRLEIPDIASRVPDSLFSQLKDNKLIVENAHLTYDSKISVAKQSISDKLKMKDKLMQEKKSKMQEVEKKLDDKNELLLQKSQTESYLTQFKSGINNSRQTPKSNRFPPAEPPHLDRNSHMRA